MIDTCYIGDVRDGLAKFSKAGVKAQMCVTSPPYWGLRDYGTGTWQGGSSSCTHERENGGVTTSGLGDYGNALSDEAITRKVKANGRASYLETCKRCGARRVDRQLGLEATPARYIAAMVKVFRAVRKVLADDGTLWLNMGDAYAQGGRGGIVAACTLGGSRDNRDESLDALRVMGNRIKVRGLKSKDMIGMPWRLALALQADGWWLRKDIIWHKPNPMPESTRDRPTTAHEYLFLLAKSEHYYYDADAISEPASEDTHARYARGRSAAHKYADGGPGNHTIARSFEHMLDKPVAGWANGEVDHSTIAHTRPKARKGKLLHADPREVAGAAVGAEDRKFNCRVKDDLVSERLGRGPGWRTKSNESFDAAMTEVVLRRNKRSVWTIPTEPFPDAHFATFPRALVEPCILAGSRVGDVVLDPFMGSGTTAMVAQSLGRHWLGCELNGDYGSMQTTRTRQKGLRL